MKSIRRCQHIISFIIVMFIIGMAVLVLKIQREAPFYMMNSDHHELGFVYDRKGDVLFDGTGENQYPDNYFVDIYRFILDFDENDVTPQLREMQGFRLADKAEIEQLAAQGIFLHYDSIKQVFDL